MEQAKKADLGKIGITWEGEFSAEKTYEMLSVVTYNGGVYMSFVAATTGGNPEADTDKWAVCIPPMMGESIVRFDDVTETVPVSISNMKSGIPLKNLVAHIKAFMTGGKVLWDACVTTGMITHQNINNQGKIPSSALLYALNKSLTDSVSQINSNMANKVSSRSTAWLAALELSADTPFIDFHHKNSTKDWTSRIIEESEGVLNIACTGLKMNSKPLFPVEGGDITLNYLSSTKMYVRINLARTPVSLIIYPAAQTPYAAVEYACATRVGDYIECYAYGDGFVNGHALAGRLYYI